MWFNFIILSVASLVISAILPFVTGAVKKKKRQFFYSLFAGVFMSGFFNFFPMHLDAAGEGAQAIIRAFFLSVYNAMQIFTIGTEYQVITEGLINCEGIMHTVYSAWSAVLFVIAPIFTFGFVLSLFKNISERIKYDLSYFKKAYIFSDLNERALALAQDIRKEHSEAAIVFTDVFEENEEKMYELADKARDIGAICFKKDLLAVDFSRHSKNSELVFFMIDEDESENLNQAIEIIGRYKERENTSVYVFSCKTESELLLTAVDKGKVKVRRINHIRSLINRVLYERGDLLFKSARKADDGVSDISAVVVGMGRHGTEMVKALSWFCQMDGYRVEINGFDKDKKAKEKFKALAPDLMNNDYNKKTVAGEAQYSIEIHSDTDSDTSDFANEIQKLTNTTYVLVALGDDDKNTDTAVRLRMLFERMGIHPVIQAIVYNTRQCNALTDIKNYRGQLYDIEFIGSLESCFTEEVIMSSELEAEALSRHLKWGNEEEFWAYEYNYRSSVASAIHRNARINRGIPGADKKENELTAKEKEAISILEHRRWNAYMRSEGYVYSGSRDPKSRNDLAKTHHDLVTYAELSDEDKAKDSSVGTE